ncbi:trypsin-like peptidase domain-containing protein [Candidatus Woesearchaeota archaeon]|nr:trypsin-like peptidase domain-containing protein [Candidatus Woesearchaeota archaeon]
MKKVLTSIMAAATIFSSGSCANVYQAVETQQQSYQQSALEDILQSVVCLRNTTTYVNPEGEKREAIVFGTGFAYKREDDWSYVTTNNHVGNMPETQVSQDMFGLSPPVTWKKVEAKVEIIESRFDANPKDDIPLEIVRSDAEVDTLVLKTRTPLHIAHSYRVSSLQEHFADTVYVTGVPLGFNKGIVEGIVFNPQVTLNGHNYTMLDITIQPGQSGSPVFIKGTDNEFYLVGQIRACMPSAWGICGGFGLAIEMSELQDVWRIGQYEPLPFPDIFVNTPKKE